MKRAITLICAYLLLMLLVACGNNSVSATDEGATSMPQTESKTDESNDVVSEESNVGGEIITQSDSSILVVNFSCTGNTKPIAEKVADYLNADFYEIVPAIPYTDADINYSDDNCRANKEQADDSARPEIAGDKVDVNAYDTVIISFPIWWGKEPRIIDTFMETYDLSGKILTCFCTSGGSGITTAESNLRAYVSDGRWLDGMRFEAGASDDELENWISSIGLTPALNEETENPDMVNKMKVQIGEYTFTATLEENEAVNELIEMMKEGPVVLDLDDYSGFEKVGSLGKSLTRSDKQTTTENGDIVLYSGNNIVIFYGSNSWSYTRLGKIDDLTDWENALGNGSVTVTLSLLQ